MISFFLILIFFFFFLLYLDLFLTPWLLEILIEIIFYFLLSFKHRGKIHWSIILISGPKWEQDLIISRISHGQSCFERFSTFLWTWPPSREGNSRSSIGNFLVRRQLYSLYCRVVLGREKRIQPLSAVLFVDTC